MVALGPFAFTKALLGTILREGLIAAFTILLPVEVFPVDETFEGAEDLLLDLGRAIGC